MAEARGKNCRGQDQGFCLSKYDLRGTVLFLLLGSCSIIESYLNHLYSAHLFTLPVHTAFNSSRTKENILLRVDEISHS